MLGSADCATRLSFLLLFLKHMLCFSSRQRSQRTIGLCAFFMLISHANLQTGHLQLLTQTQVISLPVAHSLHTLPHQSNKGMCLCLQVAAEPVSLREGSDSRGERAYLATSPVVPQVSLPHLHQRFFTLPARTALWLIKQQLICHSSQPSV